MGAGKTTVAEHLHQETGWPRVELDEEIEKLAEKTIPELFEHEGEQCFRELETEALRHQSSKPPPRIISCGGGAPLKPENKKIMENSGLPVYLHVTVETAWNRVGGDPQRPLATDKESFRQLWENRQPAYQTLPYQVDADDADPVQVKDALVELLVQNTEAEL